MRFAPILFYCATLLAAPPKSIPTQYLDAFTLGGEIAVESFYRDDSYPPEHPLIYEFEALKKKALAREENYYGPTDIFLYAALDKYALSIQVSHFTVQ